MASGEVLEFPVAPATQTSRPTAVRGGRDVLPARVDLDAERAVLGSILLDERCERRVLERVSRVLSAGDFYSPVHAVVFESMQRVAASGADVDVITVVSDLRLRDRLNTVGGAQFIGELTDAMPTVAHCESHAEIVASHSAARRLIEEARAFAQRIERGREPLDALVEGHFEKLRKIEVPGRVTLKLGDDVDGTLAEIESRTADETLHFLSTGIADMNDALGGGYPSGLHLLAARPSLGKTAWALQLARLTCQSGGSVFFLQAEMAARPMTRISIAAMAGVSYDRVQHPKSLTPDDYGACMKALNTISGWPFYLSARGEKTQPRTVAGLRRAVLALPSKPRLVVVDHVGKIQPRVRHQQTRDDYREISDDLVGLARDLDVPILVLAHIGRAMAKGTICRLPQIEDLAECSALEGDADSVVLMHNEAVYPTKKYEEGLRPDPSITDFMVGKFRGTRRSRVVKLRFIGQHQTFEPLFLQPEFPEGDASTFGSEFHGENIVPNDAPEFDFGGHNG